MDWLNEEVNKRLNYGKNNCSSALEVSEKGENIQKQVECEEKSRVLNEEKHDFLKRQLIEAQETNKKLEIQIEESRKESRRNKIISYLSIFIALASLIVAIIALVLR